MLIAEDNPIVLCVLKNQLEKAGYEVTTTLDGRAVLEALKGNTFSWALLDIGLPKLKGTEACEKYRQWEKEKNKPYLPIFALTSHQVEGMQKACEQAGFDKAFMKPFDNKTIAEIEAFLYVN